MIVDVVEKRRDFFLSIEMIVTDHLAPMVSRISAPNSSRACLHVRGRIVLTEDNHAYG